MTENGATQHWAAEFPLPGIDSAIPLVAGRPVHMFWCFMAPHFGGVLLPPHRHLDDLVLHFTWTELDPVKPIAAAELAAVRKRLHVGALALADAATEAEEPEGEVGGQSRKAVLTALSESMTALVYTLVSLPDAQLAAHACRTTTGVRLHSWGAREAGRPHRTDTPPAADHSETPHPALAAANATKPTTPPSSKRVAWRLGLAGVVLGLLGMAGWQWSRAGALPGEIGTINEPRRPHVQATTSPAPPAPELVRDVAEPVTLPLSGGRSPDRETLPPLRPEMISPAAQPSSGRFERSAHHQEVFASRQAASALASSGSSLSGSSSVAGGTGAAGADTLRTPGSGATGTAPNAVSSAGAAAASPDSPSASRSNGASSPADLTPPPQPSNPPALAEAGAVSPGDPTPARAPNSRRTPHDPREPDLLRPPADLNSVETAAETALPMAGGGGAELAASNAFAESPFSDAQGAASTDQPDAPSALSETPGEYPGRPIAPPSVQSADGSEEEGSALPESGDRAPPRPAAEKPLSGGATVYPVSPPTGVTRLRIRQTPWATVLAVDAILPTQPVPARLRPEVDAVQRVLWNERQAQRPTSFGDPRSRTGLVFAPRAGSPRATEPLTWTGETPELPGVTTASTSSRAVAIWPGLIDSTDLAFELANGRESVAWAKAEADGALLVTWTEAVELHLRLELLAPETPAALRQRLRWEITFESRSVLPAAFDSELPSAALGVSVPCPAGIGETEARCTILLVDPVSGWALRSELTFTKSEASGD